MTTPTPAGAAPQAAAPRSNVTPLAGLLAAAVYGLLLLLLWRAGIITPDFFPLYLGADLVRAGQSPYGPAATSLLVERWDAPDPFPAAGIAYPLPVLALVAPLTLLPYPYAAALWIALGAGLALLAARLGAAHPLTPLLYWPVFWAIAIGQATLIWLGLCALLALALDERRAWLAGLCIALLPLKPQSGIVFALAGLWWAWRQERRALWWAAGFGAALAAGSLALQPSWVAAWLGQLAVYGANVRPAGLYLWLPVMLLACWRLPWWARAGVVQVFAFPLVRQQYGIDPYTVAPLALVWCGVAGRLGLAGALGSWLWPVLLLLGQAEAATPLVLLAPLALAAAYRSWGPELSAAWARLRRPA